MEGRYNSNCVWSEEMRRHPLGRHGHLLTFFLILLDGVQLNEGDIFERDPLEIGNASHYCHNRSAIR